MKRRNKIIALLLAVMLLLSGCATGNPQQESVSNAESQQESQDMETPAEEPQESEDAALPEADKSVYMDASVDVETRVEALLSQMTLEEKAAQMVQAEQAHITVEEVESYGVGSVLSGGGSAPASGNTAKDWSDRVNELKTAALKTRLGIPLLYGIDAVHGNNNVYGTTIYPHNIGLGATGDTELAERIGRAVAEEVRAIGVQWTFAPTLGNPQIEFWGRTYECFSEDALEVAEYGAAFIRGFQGVSGTEEYLDETHVLACAKHYIGEGYTVDGINQGEVAMSAEEFDALLASGVLDPYTKAIDEGVRTVMLSYNTVDGVKCHENKHLVREILKEELGFTGLVVGDYNAVQQLSGVTYKEQVRQAVDAGLDLFMEVSTWKEVMGYIVELVEEGGLTQEQIDDAVRRILRVKFEAGLFEEKIAGETEQELFENIGSDEHRELAREAVRKSLVLLKNDTVNGKTAIEALNEAGNIRIFGEKAYDIGTQCGGWTISWQGQAGKITKGTTIIDGIAAQVMPEKTLSHDIGGIVQAENEAIIAVFGEEPYAEMYGDRTPETLTISDKDRTLLNNLKDSLEAQGKEDILKVAIITAGRPVNITQYMDMFDAVIMAWLPGTEGAGIADVLFGDYDFTGKLTYTWLKDPVNMDKKFTENNEEYVLFEKGYGLNKKGERLP